MAFGDSPGRLILALAAALASFAGWSDAAHAFRAIDVGSAIGSASPYYARWDAAPRSIDGIERSLDGGLRYSLEGGSYEAFRDQFTWSSVPSVPDFQAAIEAAFAAWEATDPVTGLSTRLSFVADLATPVVDSPGDLGNRGSFLGLNDGAEIDLIAETPHLGPSYGASVVFFLELQSFREITLTSGATGYAGLAIAGADLRINPAHTFSLEYFQLLLTHEIGHAIGLGDVDVYPDVLGVFSPFFDDDYDGANSATALATLTNSFALEIDPLDPDSTPLLPSFSDLNGDPGLDTPGVDIVMEGASNSGVVPADLQNDDFAGRQFLYPLPPPACGDGARDPREGCDDGNMAGGDGCSALCEIDCATQPRSGCIAAGRSRLSIRAAKPGKERLSLVVSRFSGGSTQEDLGDPVSGATRIDVCVYRDSATPVAQLSVERAGALCGEKPCWSTLAHEGYVYEDPSGSASGVRRIGYESGPRGAGELALRAANHEAKGQSALPAGLAAALQGASSVRVQVLASGGACFDGELADVGKADGLSVVAEGP